MTTKEQHAEFQGDLDRSDKSVHFIAEWLRSRDNEVTELEHTVAPTFEERHEHSDHGDLELITPAGLVLLGEVKESYKYSYTVDEGHPFPNRVFTEWVDKYARKDPKPDWYFLLSACWSTVVTVACAGDWWWWKADAPDRITGKMKPTWCTRIERCELHDLRGFDPSAK